MHTGNGPHGTAALPDLAQARAAAALLEGKVLRTPLLECAPLAADLGLASAHLKAECLQPGGAFKLRGATTFLLRHGRGAPGAVAWSSGNHGIAVARAARAMGLPVAVVVPADITSTKRRQLAGLGAEVLEEGRTSSEREARARRIAAERGYVAVPPFDDPWIVAGQATVGLELAKDLPEGTEVVLVPCGGGGLLAGVALVLGALRPEIEVVGVEPSGADAMARSLEAGELVSVDPGPTLADGLKPTVPGMVTFAVCRGRVRTMLRVEDEHLLAAMGLLLRLARLAVEPSGAAPVAAVLAHGERLVGRRVAMVLSGSNAEPELLHAALRAAP